MNVQGIIKTIGETKQVTDRMKKRELTLVTKDGNYEQTLLIEFINDQCEVLDKYADGKDVTIDINLKGREWTNPEGVVKVFNSIQGWRIFPTGAQQYGASTSDSPEIPANPELPAADESDSPF